MKSYLRNILYLLVVCFLFILPILWINDSTRLGCLNNLLCNTWEFLRGFFLWPFLNVWSDVGKQRIMITYALIGIGIILLYIIHRIIKIEQPENNIYFQKLNDINQLKLPDKKYLTLEDLAIYYRTSTKVIEKLVKDNTVETIREGNILLIPKEKFEKENKEWIDHILFRNKYREFNF